MLPDQVHCYFLNGDAPVQDGRSLQGALVSKIPFCHPAQVPLLLDIIRHQAAYNTLIGSCVKRTSIKEGICLLSGSVWSVLCLRYLTSDLTSSCLFSVRQCRPAAVWGLPSDRLQLQRLLSASSQWVFSLWWAVISILKYLELTATFTFCWSHSWILSIQNILFFLQLSWRSLIRDKCFASYTKAYRTLWYALTTSSPKLSRGKILLPSLMYFFINVDVVFLNSIYLCL